MRSLFIGIASTLLGIVSGFVILAYFSQTLVDIKYFFFPQKPLQVAQKEIIGFLPYWLVTKAQADYSDTITTLTYFGLIVGPDGKIQYLANEQEEEPGWHMLKSERMQTMLKQAKDNNVTLSLLVFSGDADAIDALISNPVSHAENLVNDVEPIMKKYGFTDLNLDIESTRNASDGAQKNFTHFAMQVKKAMQRKNLGTVTIEITGNDLIRKNVINPKDIGQIADFVVIMAYDFHYMGSLVTGPVAPIGGSETEAEFDTNIVLGQAYKVIPKEKIILGIPTYGYSWETLGDTPRSAVMPGSGLTVSSSTAEKFLKTCASCSALVDKKAYESYVIYKDVATGTYHQLFYPDKSAIQKKVALVTDNNLAGVAVWALGYEGPGVLSPLTQYKKDIVDITRL